MKKENIVKKVFLSSLIGFPIGVTLLMLAYVSIYLIAGENIFVNEINQLANIKTLISQIVTVGVVYYLIFIGHSIFSNIDSLERHKKHPYKTIVLMAFIYLVYLFAVVVLGSEYVFSTNIGAVNMVLVLTIYVAYIVYSAIKWMIERKEIKKINKKLEEKNS